MSVFLPGWVLHVVLLHLTRMKAKSLMNRKMARQRSSETSCETEQKQVLLISIVTRPKQSQRLLFASGGALEKVKSQWVRSSEALFSLGMATAATVCSVFPLLQSCGSNCYYVIIYSVFYITL